MIRSCQTDYDLRRLDSDSGSDILFDITHRNV